MRRTRLGWMYVLLFNVVAQLVEPRASLLSGWLFIWAADLALCAARIWLAREMSSRGRLTPLNILLFGWLAPLQALLMSCTISLWYLTFGFDPAGLLATLVLSGFALSSLVVYRPNLRILRRMVISFLLIPALTALWIRGTAGWAIAIHLSIVLFFCLFQGRLENSEFWESLHATRDVKIARRRAEAAAGIQAELIANRARQLALTAERTRIAAEWHDTLLGGFSAIAWQIEAAQSKLAAEGNDAGAALALARTMLNHYRAEARLVIADLQNSLDNEGDLKLAIARAIEPLLHGRSVVLNLEVAGPEPSLPGAQRHHLVRICQEAVANALQHASPKSVTVRIANEGSSPTVEIRDDGVGFPIAAVLKPEHFGLDIMKERAHRIGAEFEISSHPGLGTTILVKLPAMAASPRSQTRILVVEDQPFAQLALRSLHESREDLNIVATAGSGAAAIQLFREHMPDIAIVDLHLPDMSGIDVIKAIRASNSAAHVIALSSFGGTEQVRRATDVGASAYVTKEAGHEELLQAIDAVVSGATNNQRMLSKRLQPLSAKDELTRRERDVLEQLVLGLTDRDIAMRLGIGNKAVRHCVATILSKLGADSRSQAVELAIRRGAVDPPRS